MSNEDAAGDSAGINLTVETLAPGEETGPFDDLDMGRSEQRPETDIGPPSDKREPKKEDKPKAGPPRLDEWEDFFARVILKAGTDFYVDHLFRGIDEEQLTDSEIRRVYLSVDECKRIAKPFSELANKLSITRKHGRTIIAASGTIDSVLTLGMWFSRVNRIAARHKTVTAKVVGSTYEPTGSYSENGTGRPTVNGTGQFSNWDGFPESPGTG